jgi:hypothetical protein
VSKSIFATWREMQAADPSAAGKFYIENGRAIRAAALAEQRALISAGKMVEASIFGQLHQRMLVEAGADETDVERGAVVERLAAIEKAGLTELHKYESLRAESPVAASVYRDTRARVIAEQTDAFEAYLEKHLDEKRPVADPLGGFADAFGPT